MVDAITSRRGFIKGAALLSFALALPRRGLLAAADEARAFSPSALLRIAPDNTVRIFMPHGDLGSGIYTGLAQILADELDADWSTIVTEHLDSLDAEFKHPEWGVIATGASTSVATQWKHLRTVGATARAMLLEAAAQTWAVPVTELVAANSVVSHAASKRQASYGQLSARAATLTPPTTVELKSPSQFKFIGRSMDRLDRAIKSDGSARFGIDVQLPDMLYAAVAHAPSFGAKLASCNKERAAAMPGVKAVVEIASGVAVVADSYWRAKKAKDALELRWQGGEFEAVSSADLWRQYSELAGSEGTPFEQRGQLDFAAAQSVVEGELRFPFLAHAPMEPLNATAQIKGDGCELWASTQFQGIDVMNIEKATGIKAASIKINTQWLGGSFGRRASPQGDFLVEAVRIAQAAQLPNPIKMLWQREDDIQGGFYRPMALHRYKIGVDGEGRPAHWQHHLVCAPITRGTFFEPLTFVKGIDAFSIAGLAQNLYAGANVDYRLHNTEHAVPVCWIRGEGDSHTGPTVEAIINRLARHSGEDPFRYRRKLLAGKAAAARTLAVLELLEKASNWAQPPAADVFRGMAVHTSFGSVCGYVVELRKAAQDLRFHKVTAAFDCGLVINPERVKAQVYSAVAFALSTVIGQKIEIANGAAAQSNFHDYTVAAMRHMPEVDVHLVASPLDYPTGVGEVGVPPFIPALSEAVFAATGQEVVEFPMRLRGVAFLGG